MNYQNGKILLRRARMPSRRHFKGERPTGFHSLDHVALARFYMAASALLTGWKAFEDLVVAGDAQACEVEKLWHTVEHG